MSDENNREEEGAVNSTKAEANSPSESPSETPPEAPVTTRRVETDEEKAARRKASFEAREAAKVAAAQAAGRQASVPASAPTPAAAVPSPTEAGASATQATAPATGEAAPATPRRVETDEEKAARRKASFEAREAAKAAAAQAATQAPQAVPAGSSGGNDAAAASPSESKQDEAPPKEPSPNQPRLDRVVTLLRELIAEDSVEEAYINEPNDHLPTIVVKNDRWLQAAKLFRSHDDLSCNYLRNVSGVDYETHMEVVYYPLNMDSRDCYCIKVRADREQPSIPSVTPIWETANWNEREIYDLLGIEFPGHPDLRRIMMPDDWVGHPLRKDYVPLDPEV